ncbi:MAG: STAS domain-containing protein [Planctomycetota bacterium]|nr:STAS domain-containing protein [Planctomycetota bacterium]MCX8040374.1 STAS domain-containing protein [Planctomycetota bacterium]MDW8373750.1 STAS domain-containing protein [Planctomycetota bacterium]
MSVSPTANQGDIRRALHIVQVHTEGAVRVVSFARDERGQVPNDAVRAYFASLMLDHTHEWHRVVFDLSGVASLDSAALGPLVQKLRETQASQGRLVLTGVEAPALREIFALTRFDRVFPILPNRAAAIAMAAS